MEGEREKGERDERQTDEEGGGQRERRERGVHSDVCMHESKSRMRMDGSKETRMARTV